MSSSRQRLFDFLKTGDPIKNKELTQELKDTPENDLAFPLMIMETTEDRQGVLEALCLENLEF